MGLLSSVSQALKSSCFAQLSVHLIESIRQHILCPLSTFLSRCLNFFLLVLATDVEKFAFCNACTLASCLTRRRRNLVFEVSAASLGGNFELFILSCLLPLKLFQDGRSCVYRSLAQYVRWLSTLTLRRRLDLQEI